MKDLDLLWRRLQDAKSRLDDLHVIELRPDYAHALQAEEAAATEYIRALHDLQAAQTTSTLTPRERQVLRLIAAGKSSREVAAHLGLAFKTVVVHRHRIYRKLEIHKNVDLVRAAMRMGLV